MTMRLSGSSLADVEAPPSGSTRPVSRDGWTKNRKGTAQRKCAAPSVGPATSLCSQSLVRHHPPHSLQIQQRVWGFTVFYQTAVTIKLSVLNVTRCFVGPILKVVDSVDKMIQHACPFGMGLLFCGGVYWTAFTYGFIVVLQVRKSLAGTLFTCLLIFMSNMIHIKAIWF